MTKHFSLDELVYSATAVKHGILNLPGERILANLKALAIHLLEPLRLAAGAAIRVLSGYRCRRLNCLIHGNPASRHMEGTAADLYFGDGPEQLLKILLANDIDFDQAIIYRNKKILHVSFNPHGPNRREVIRK